MKRHDICVHFIANQPLELCGGFFSVGNTLQFKGTHMPLNHPSDIENIKSRLGVKEAVIRGDMMVLIVMRNVSVFTPAVLKRLGKGFADIM